MSVMCEEEITNAHLVSALQPPVRPTDTTSVTLDPPTAFLAETNPLVPTNENIDQLDVVFPALSTKTKLNSILKNGY